MKKDASEQNFQLLRINSIENTKNPLKFPGLDITVPRTVESNLFIQIGYEEALEAIGNLFFFKQFVVTNCSKERPGSIVTVTLKMEFDTNIDQKNWIFMLILSMQVSSSSVLPIKSYEPEKICLILVNREKHPLKVIKS